MTFAGVVAFSRVSVGVHYPFDILAGAVLGVVIGVLVLFGYRFIIGQWSRRQKTGESA